MGGDARGGAAAHDDGRAGSPADEEYLSTFAGVYLEDSYFLGITAEGCDLRLKFLFALTSEHPHYAPPAPGEAHWFSEGSILLARPRIVAWEPGAQRVMRDPDGSYDFGSAEIYRRGPSRFRFVTEWFEATVDVDAIRLDLADRAA